jgi:hypothetical protein
MKSNWTLSTMMDVVSLSADTFSDQSNVRDEEKGVQEKVGEQKIDFSSLSELTTLFAT